MLRDFQALASSGHFNQEPRGQHPSSSLFPGPFHTRSVERSSASSRGYPKVGDETENCLESQAPRKQHSENKSCYFNYGSCCLLSHRSLSHMFIRNLVINHSLEARNCQGHCLQLSPLPCPGCILLEPSLIHTQPGASSIGIPGQCGAWESD